MSWVNLSCAFILGHNIEAEANHLIAFGADQVFLADAPELEHFLEDSYSQVIADLVAKERPNIILMGATAIGRSLAPKVAARFRDWINRRLYRIRS